METSKSRDKSQVERLQHTRKVYRAAQDLNTKFENVMRQKQSHKVVFEKDVIEMRNKLKEYSEKLIFLNPVDFGRKAEELLWWKVFYSVISAVKKSKKHLRSGSNFECAYRTHLMAAQGFYHHLLLRIQKEFNLHLSCAIDFVYSPNRDWGVEADVHHESNNPRAITWAEKACHRCLIYLGDLARYQKDLDGLHVHYIAERYYHQALALNPELGMPHNQLGTLAGNSHEGVDAAYHYMRCWLYDVPFEGAIANLEKSLEKNCKRFKELPSIPNPDLPPELLRPRDIKHFLIRFLHLIEKLQPSMDIGQQELGKLCQSTLHEFDKCMLMTQDKSPPGQGVGLMRNGEETRLHSLSGDIVFKVFMLLLMTITRLRKKGSKKTTMAVVCTLALFSQLLGHIIARLQAEIDEILHPQQSQNTQPTQPEDIPTTKAALDYASPADTLTPSLSQDVDSDGTVRLAQQPGGKGTRSRRRRRKAKSQEKEHSDESDLSEGDESMISSQSDFTSSDDEEDPFAIDSDSDYFLEPNDSEEREAKRNEKLQSKTPEMISASREEDNSDGNLKDITSQLMAEGASLPLGRRSIKLAPSFDAFTKSSSESDIDVGVTEENLGEKDEKIADGPVIPLDQLLEILSNDGLISVVKVLTDWLRAEIDTIKSTAENSQTLWSRYAGLLNFLPNDLETRCVDMLESNHLKTIVKDALLQDTWIQPVPLTEDMAARKIPVLENAHKLLNFRQECMLDLSEADEDLIRIICLKKFGEVLAGLDEVAFHWDGDTKHFVCKALDVSGIDDLMEKQEAEEKAQKALAEEKKQKLMKSMAQLRMQSVVRKLEGSILNEDEGLPPYVIPIADVMCNQLNIIRQLSECGRFVVVIPQDVMSSLDVAKKQQVKAREAIKFLEKEFQRGNKYIKAQKEKEMVNLDDKKKGKEDKLVKSFYSLVECGAYFAEQEPSVGPVKSSSGLVVILTDTAFTRYQNPALQYAIKMAKEYGVETCHVVEFHKKWKEIN
ncbi:nonsense-mediated mRNA decay factor SMG5-like isoform X1 [Apostichopus japonicus]|uniref:nonsense-mediated mRNA decay factor SMG5-like isoform X1 n=1 Tax=Stichopus japonicus TaxID=307972 RepID=UPI003AB6B7A0